MNQLILLPLLPSWGDGSELSSCLSAASFRHYKIKDFYTWFSHFISFPCRLDDPLNFWSVFLFSSPHYRCSWSYSHCSCWATRKTRKTAVGHWLNSSFILKDSVFRDRCLPLGLHQLLHLRGQGHELSADVPGLFILLLFLLLLLPAQQLLHHEALVGRQQLLVLLQKHMSVLNKRLFPLQLMHLKTTSNNWKVQHSNSRE